MNGLKTTVDIGSNAHNSVVIRQTTDVRAQNVQCCDCERPSHLLKDFRQTVPEDKILSNDAPGRKFPRMCKTRGKSRHRVRGCAQS